MDVAATIESVRDATATERDRLGSDKALVAATGASLLADVVLDVAATREAGIASALDQWASEESDEQMVETFSDAAAAAADRRDRIDGTDAGSDAFASHLDAVEGAPNRVGAGLVAWPLVADCFYLQVINFFVNESEEGTADVFRDIRANASALDRGEAALEQLSESERETAADAAIEAIGVAYEEYAESLEAIGLDPKPIC